MFSLFDKAAFPIGIDIGSHALRLLQFKKAPGAGGGDVPALALHAACRLELDAFPGSEIDKCIAALKHGLAAQPFSGKRIAVALPATLVQAKSIRLPQMPDSDLTQALGWEAKDRFGFDTGDAAPVPGQPAPGQLTWFRAGEVRRGTEVKDELHLFAVPGDPLNAYISAFTALGLKFVAIDLAPCAAFRALARATPAIGTGTSALLDVGHQGAQFMIACDGELAFYKHIDIGGKKISEAIAAKLGISPLEATQMRARLAQDAAAAQDAASLHQALRDAMRAPLEELSRELDMCLRYYVITFRGARPDAIRLFGRQASCPFLKESLAASLGFPVEEAQPLRGVQNLGDTARPDRSGEWATAAGLSLYPLHSGRKEAAA